MIEKDVTHAEFLRLPETQKLIELLKDAKIDARFVGGCVRDSLLGRKVHDVDLASQTTPEEVLRKLQPYGYKLVPTGIEHGTITIVIEGRAFEITTLRRDVDCDGRHAIVAYTEDWQQDAMRRDFTVNALYADFTGKIYDYADGVQDIEKRVLRFIGVAEQRIKEDALRILRLFRFYAQLDFSVDETMFEICKKRVKTLTKVSPERIHIEIMKLLASKDPCKAWTALHTWQIAEKIFGNMLSNDMASIVEVEKHLKLAALRPAQRLALLAFLAKDDDADQLKNKLKLSNDETKTIKRLFQFAPYISADMSINEQHKWQYLMGADNYILCITALAAQQYHQHHERSMTPYQRLVDEAKSWQAPRFEISGQDLIERGFAPGKEMGEKLKLLEAKWIESGFSLERDKLLASC